MRAEVECGKHMELTVTNRLRLDQKCEIEW